MGKISPVSSKYIVNATIEIEGVVDRPDVIGAIFGQTEGLLGEELELRELQRSGRIGRIEVNIDTKGGKSIGQIIIPSSLDKAETAIVAAALEVIQRIGPCNAKVRVQNIEDVRISKRTFVIERAKQLLRNLMDNVMPDSQEIAEEVAHSIRVMEITEYGKDRLPAGPEIESSEEVIVVEGRADVMNLLKHGFKNSIAMNGTSVPQTVIELSHRKDIVVFVDGDRGGNLILRDLFNVAEVDFVTRAPDGKEVEELAKKEIHKALRSRITVEQAKLELGNVDTSQAIRKPMIVRGNATPVQGQPPRLGMPPRPMQGAAPVRTRPILRDEERKVLGGMLEGLVGTKGAFVLDEKMNVLGKVPLSELNSTLRTLNTGVYAVVLDGSIDRDLIDVAETSTLKHIVGMDTKVKPMDSRLNIVTAAEL
ncbi:DNA primase [Candidatus Woesearchaeota archaeon]|nr:DNA primase [Candidatus Woesearchaeota archaeon]